MVSIADPSGLSASVLLSRLTRWSPGIRDHLFPVIGNGTRITMTKRAYGKVQSDLDTTFWARSRGWFIDPGVGFRRHGRIAKDPKHGRIGE